jgi:DNA-binding NarL/FixJ family response regulator
MGISVSDVRLHLSRIHEKLTATPITKEKRRLAEIAKAYALTLREVQVLEELYNGATNSDIAGDLFITESTVKFHVRNLFGKVGIADRTQIKTFVADFAAEKN